MADGFYSSTSGGYYQSQQNQQPYSSQGFYNSSGSNAATGGYPSSSQPSGFQPNPAASTGTTANNAQGQSQKPISASIFNPNTVGMISAVSSGNKDAMFGYAEQAGKDFLSGGAARLIPGLELFMQTLRPYFAVNNTFVRKKIQRIVCSFLYKEWDRVIIEPTGPDVNLSIKCFASPASDENALDLYIPSMSLVTYVLLCALCYGTAGKFDPQVLSNVMTKCFLTQLLEVLGVRFGLYMMQVADLSFCDLFALTGYKYLSLCLNMLMGLFLEYVLLGSSGARGFYIAFLWTASSVSWFVFKTTTNNIPLTTSSTGPKREIMILAFAASQFATMWFVSQTKYLN